MGAYIEWGSFAEVTYSVLFATTGLSQWIDPIVPCQSCAPLV
jgi:hypothetical protein